MITAITIAAMFLMVLILLYRGSGLLLTTFSLALLLAAYSAYQAIVGDVGPGVIASWSILLLAAVVFNIRPLRRRLISSPGLKAFRRIMPDMSDTEREALEAGTVWWEGELFSGRPDWNQLSALPAGVLSDEEQAFLDGPVQELCAMVDEWKVTHEWGDLPPEAWAFIKENGFFAMIIPKAYGGLEFSALAQSEVLTRVAGHSPTAASLIAVPNSLGPGELLEKYGTDEQKNHYLPRLARGEEIPCFGLTGPRNGSDAASLTDTGIVCKGEWQGQEVTGIRLNWKKRYITLAPVATVLGLAFRLYDPDHLMGDTDDYGITAALIPTDLPGVTTGRRHFPLNIPFQNGPTEGEDVFIPLDFIIGGPAMAGQGWRMLMECLAAGRAISLPSNTTGGALAGIYSTGAYARLRRQFNMPIGKFEGVEEALARMGGYGWIMDAARRVTATAIDQGQEPPVAGAILKYHVTEMARVVGNDVMDVQAGKAICMGPRNNTARGYQSIPIAITVEGANILTRNMIIFGQGAIRCHPWVLKQLHAALETDQKKAVREYDAALFGHLGFTMSNAVRAFWLGLTRGRGTSAPGGDTRRYYQHISRFSAAFALMADVSMLTLGGALKKRERISARLGDMLSYMYLASMVLKRYEDLGRPGDDLPFVEWACRDLIYKLQEQLHGLLRNFPSPLLARILRLMVFPRGRSFSAPSDALGHQIADRLISESSSRERLTRPVYVGQDGPMKQLADALAMVDAVEPLEKRVREAVRNGRIPHRAAAEQYRLAGEAGILDDEECKLMLRYDALLTEIIAVDDFDGRELGTRPFDGIPAHSGTDRDAGQRDHVDA
ncbi:acyl-CoA dehydrogenase [Natronospira bacteriovora]|uniref:Acyl-coenzyme A dehydrogenase n=1 Tax=Natronospira bacteriovora TaxID=3069753 RepID=A0ABU0W9Z0_9GAMM|nr:acyl-CoA dehydrogenase [Natronospira sp. AB-CW4]MDQ2070848.1 acyl-CoA dehydrogenase [Natronospira sp. AB-CW4]